MDVFGPLMVGNIFCKVDGTLIMALESVHEQSRKRALGCRQVDTPIPERHLERVPPIRLR